MNLEQKEDTIEAINKLITFYKGYHENAIPLTYGSVMPDNCPLCEVDSKYIKNNTEACSKCPWEIFEDSLCSGMGYRQDTTLQRLKRLNRWLGFLKKEE